MHDPALDPTFAILVVYGFVAHAFQRLVNRVRIYAALALLQLYRSLCRPRRQAGCQRAGRLSLWSYVLPSPGFEATKSTIRLSHLMTPFQVAFLTVPAVHMAPFLSVPLIVALWAVAAALMTEAAGKE